uniref:Transcriptional regulator, TetR family n=1 Tax=uncultured organism TaxID=155900 RepID=M1PQE8_9ZZZZ|nr:transcriptional regulator, TetR family [uncultured organism]
MSNYKQDIIDVAVDLFAEHGYHGTSMNMIAREAGVSKGGLYWYFCSKKDLYSSIIEMPFKDYIKFIKKVEKKETSPKEKIKSIISFRVNYIKNNQGLSRMIVNELGNLEILKEKIFKYKKQNEDIMTGIFKEGVKEGQFKIKDTYVSVMSFTSIINSIASNPEILSEKTTEELIEAVTYQVFQGIGS